MSSSQREQLLALLSPEGRQAFEEAKRLAHARGGVLSPLHLFLAAVECIPQRDVVQPIVRAAEEALAKLYPSHGDSITVTKETQSALLEAGRIAKAEGGLVQPLHLVRATLVSPAVNPVLTDEIRGQVEAMVRGASEPQALRLNERVEDGTADQKPTIARPSRPLTGALREFCCDLAEEALAGSSHPFVGREREITAVLETLCRKLKSNPLLIGKPGVGKTAIVTAVAVRINEDKVPTRLRGKRILEVSRLRLLADAKYTGEIEERLQTLLEEVRKAGDVILFFDEIHTLFGAGGAGGTGDVANLLKSSLSKGEITSIGATTLAEYYKYIARDEALARRFSTLTIEEPSAEETRRILVNSRGAFEAYHGVKIQDEVVDLIVDTADRFLHWRSFPDKAFDLLDKAAAKSTLAGSDQLTRESVTETLSEMTGLPLEIMDEDPGSRLEKLEDFLNSAVPGQARAARDVARVVRIAKLGLELKPEQPDGVFLFIGPEGVGKREMAQALAKFLYGSQHKITEFDMSQFTEPWSLSRLTGAEPGYVGYGDRSGLLSKAAEDNPHSVLYFRNIDLAHPIIQQFLGEALEHGRFTDSEGARISLSNTTVVMSLSHPGANNKHATMGFSPPQELSGARRLPTAALSRERISTSGLVEGLSSSVDEVIEFHVLDREATERIIRERINALSQRMQAAQPCVIKLDPKLVSFFADLLAAERQSVAQLERLWQESVVVPFTTLRLDRRAVGALPEVTIDVQDNTITVAINRTTM